LEHLLTVEMPGIEELRAQQPYVRALAGPAWPPWNIELYVPDEAPPAKRVLSQVPIEAHSLPLNAFGLNVTLWMDGDYLGSIEVSWEDDEPTRMPRPNELAPARRTRFTA
jgi:hypothetical protein